MKKYVLRCGEYYLADLMYDCNKGELVNFSFDRNYKIYYDDIDSAFEDLKLIYIEIGILLKVEEYETEDK